MNKRILAFTIIGLCLISVLIGTINTIVVANKKVDTDNVQEKSAFLGLSSGGNKIALINLEGAITSESSGGFMSDMNSAEGVRKSLKRAYKDKSVKGILLKINSPGGTVGMSQEIYSLILKIRKEKPVVISMSDIAASGGYYIASAGDRIFAQPGTLTGSIGVIMNSYDAHQLLNEKLGLKMNTIKSGKYKDLASPFRPISKDERALLQNLINSTYNQFVNAIIAGRVNRTDKYKVEMSVLTKEKLKKYADGRIFTGEQAKQLGFVDQLGGLLEAQDAVNKMAHNKFKLSKKELPVVQYNTPSGLNDLFSGVSETLAPKKDLTSILIPFSAKHPHQTLFMWE